MKYEWRKAEKAIYGVKASPTLVTVPEQAIQIALISLSGFRLCTLLLMQLKWIIKNPIQS